MGDGLLFPVTATSMTHSYIDEHGVMRVESGEARLRRLLYAEWRAAFYAGRSRWMEGQCFTVLADSDAEAIHLLLGSQVKP